MNTELKRSMQDAVKALIAERDRLNMVIEGMKALLEPTVPKPKRAAKLSKPVEPLVDKPRHISRKYRCLDCRDDQMYTLGELDHHRWMKHGIQPTARRKIGRPTKNQVAGGDGSTGLDTTPDY